MSECELNGFGLGGTADQMREALGEPDVTSMARAALSDYPHIEYQYDGLRIVFSTSGRSAMTFFVTSGKYRLRSGVGVGSTRQEIESALGPADDVGLGDTEYLGYGLTGPDGGPTPAQLIFKLDGEVAIELTMGTRFP